MAWTRLEDGTYYASLLGHVYTVSRGKVYAWIVKCDGETVGNESTLAAAKAMAVTRAKELAGVL